MLALGLLAGTAHADTSLHATGSLTFAYNDNLYGETSNPTRVFLLQPAPGIMLFHEAPRALLVLSYTNPFVFYLNEPIPWTQANMGLGTGLFALSPVDELTLSIGVNRFQTSQTLLMGADQTAINPQSAGTSNLLNFTLTEGFTHEFSPSWRLLQTLGAAYTYPIDTPTQPSLFTSNATLGPEVTLGHHALGLFAVGMYTRPFVIGTTDEEDEAGYLTQDQALVGANGRWRWDWTPDWSSELSAGLGALFNFEGDARLAPIGLAAIRFDRDGYAASLSYAHSTTPSFITGQTYESDTIRLEGGVPIWAPANLAFMTSTGFSFNRVLDPTLSVSDNVNTFIADAGVGWFPDEYPQIALRYQHVEQFGANDDDGILPNFSRNVVSLTVSYTFPPRDTNVPTGPPRRVDGSDRDPLVPGTGDEPRQPTPRNAPPDAGP